MKISIFTKQFPENDFVGGAEIQAYLLAKYLAENNHQVLYLTFGEKKEINVEKNFAGFMVKYIAEIDDGNLKFLFGLYQALKKQKPDLFFIRDFRYLFLANIICRILKIKIVYNTTHINNCQPYPKKIKYSLNPIATLVATKSVLIHYLNFKTLKKVNLITINKYQAKLLKESYGINATPIYNSMEDNYPANKATPKEKNVVWVANLKNRKRPDIFINLANELKNTDYKFLLVGYLQNNADIYHNLIKEAESNNQNFKYLGGMSTDQADKLLAKSQIFVNTCLPEGFGNNFIQAWFNECPTVTLDFDPDDIIKNNEIGFHSQSFEQLIKDVEFLLKNPEIRQKMGQKAREYALANHLPQNNILKYETYFQNLIKTNWYD